MQRISYYQRKKVTNASHSANTRIFCAFTPLTAGRPTGPAARPCFMIANSLDSRAHYGPFVVFAHLFEFFSLSFCFVSNLNFISFISYNQPDVVVALTYIVHHNSPFALPCSIQQYYIVLYEHQPVSHIHMYEYICKCTVHSSPCEMALTQKHELAIYFDYISFVIFVCFLFFTFCCCIMHITHCG